MKSRVVLLVGAVALTMVAGCSSETALEHIANKQAKAKAELQEKVDEVNKAAEDMARQVNEDVKTTLDGLEKALEAGDVDALQKVVSDDSWQAIQDLGIISAWRGTGDVTVQVEEFKAAPVGVPEFDPVGFGLSTEVSKSDVFGDHDYVPTIAGKDYSTWEPSTVQEPERYDASVRVDGGQDQCVRVAKEGEDYRVSLTDGCPLSTSFYSLKSAAEAWFRVGDRQLDAVKKDFSSAGAIIGRYELVPVDDIKDFVKSKEIDPSVDPLEVEIDQKYVDEAKDFANKWVDYQLNMGNDDGRCSVFGNKPGEIDGVEVPLTFGCEGYSDKSADEVTTNKLGERHTVGFRKEGSRTYMDIKLTAAGEGPVLIIEGPSEVQQGKTASFDHEDVTVIFEVTDGKPQLAPRAIDARDW